MSFDMFANEQRANLMRVMDHPSLEAEPGIWHNFVPGSAKTTMLGFAQTARAIDLLGAVGPIVEDKLTGGTEAQDRYFREHDENWQRAVDYWTPTAGEVGTAGRVVGSLVSGLTQVVTSPGLAVGSAQLATGEDLVRKGVDAWKAQAAGAVAGTGLGLGIYMPVLGNSLASRVILGGAAANVAQGVAVRGINAQILKDTPGEKDFNPWDKEALILDGLMGAAFGTLAHLTRPEQAAVKESITPAEKDAILTANQARHVEDTTAPGRPVGDTDLTAHADAIRNAVNDVLNGRAANVEQSLQDVKFANDAQKVAAQQEVINQVREDARAAIAEVIIRNEQLVQAENTEGFLRTPEQMVALKKGQRAPEGAAELARAISIANKPGFLRSAEEKVFLDTALKGRAFEHLTAEIPAPVPPPVAIRPEHELVQKATPERIVRTISEAKTHAAAIVGQPLKNESTGLTATVSNTTLRKMTSESAVKKSNQPEDHALAVANVDKLFPAALLDHSHPDKKGEGTIAAIHRYVAPMIGRDGSVLAVKMTVKETTSPRTPNPIYSIETIDVEKPARVAPDARSGIEQVTDRGPPSSQAGFTTKVTESIRAVNDAQKTLADEATKPVDPLIAEAQARIAADPELAVHVGVDADGKPITKTMAEVMKGAADDVAQAKKDANLFTVAAQCLLGMF